MNIPGLLIEYFITGSVACIWLIPLFSNFKAQAIFTSLPQGVISLLLLPLLYIIGLGLDMTSGFLVNSFGWKRKIRDKEKERFKAKYGVMPDAELHTMMLWLHNAELGKGYEIKSSRDRIARGTALNFAIASVVVPISAYIFLPLTEVVIIFIVFSILSILFYGIWRKCEASSHRYKLTALLIVSKEDCISSNTEEG